MDFSQPTRLTLASSSDFMFIKEVYDCSFETLTKGVPLKQLPKQVMIILVTAAQAGKQAVKHYMHIIENLQLRHEEREGETFFILSQSDASSAQVAGTILKSLTQKIGSTATVSHVTDVSADIGVACETVNEHITACDTLVIVVTDAAFASRLTSDIDREYFCNIQTGLQALEGGQAYILADQEFSVI
jgi:hypothetical protein